MLIADYNKEGEIVDEEDEVCELFQQNGACITVTRRSTEFLLSTIL